MRSARLVGATVGAVAALVLTGCSPWQSAILSDDNPYGEPPPLAVGTCPWVDGSSPPSPSPPTEGDAVAVTEAIALDDERFWALIELIPDRPSEEDFNELSSQLAGCAFDDIIAFEARLTLALHALDSPAAADWLEANDPSGFGFVSDDVFLYARCASVLGGRDSWAAAVSEHTVDWGSDSPDREGMSEFLLYVGAGAADAQGIGPEEFYDVLYSTIPLSYETGSNTEFWT